MRPFFLSRIFLDMSQMWVVFVYRHIVTHVLVDSEARLRAF